MLRDSFQAEPSPKWSVTRYQVTQILPMKDCEKSALTRSEAECEVCDEAMGAEIVYQVITYFSKNQQAHLTHRKSSAVEDIL